MKLHLLTEDEIESGIGNAVLSTGFPKNAASQNLFVVKYVNNLQLSLDRQIIREIIDDWKTWEMEGDAGEQKFLTR